MKEFDGEVFKDKGVGMVCPVCLWGELEWEELNGTHVYICSETCPFVGFEYLTNKDITNLKKILK